MELEPKHKFGEKKVCKVVGDLALEKKIGQGQYGEVYKGFLKSKPDVQIAVKMLEKEKMSKEKLKEYKNTELSILMNNKHKNLVKIVGSVEESSKNYYIPMEYCENGDLATFIESRRSRKEDVSESYCIFIFKQVLEGIAELHSRNIIHRDLKLDNIFVKNNGQEVLVGDFGLSKKLLKDAGAKTQVGTPITMAPEMWNEYEPLVYGPEVDIWSLGIIFYNLLYNVQVPWLGCKNGKEIASNAKLFSGEKLPFPEEVEVSECSKHFLKKCLVIDPKARPTSAQLLKHKLFEEKFFSIGESVVSEPEPVLGFSSLPKPQDHLESREDGTQGSTPQESIPLPKATTPQETSQVVSPVKAQHLYTKSPIKDKEVKTPPQFGTKEPPFKDAKDANLPTKANSKTNLKRKPKSAKAQAKLDEATSAFVQKLEDEGKLIPLPSSNPVDPMDALTDATSFQIVPAPLDENHKRALEKYLHEVIKLRFMTFVYSLVIKPSKTPGLNGLSALISVVFEQVKSRLLQSLYDGENVFELDNFEVFCISPYAKELLKELEEIYLNTEFRDIEQIHSKQSEFALATSGQNMQQQVKQFLTSYLTYRKKLSGQLLVQEDTITGLASLALLYLDDDHDIADEDEELLDFWCLKSLPDYTTSKKMLYRSLRIHDVSLTDCDDLIPIQEEVDDDGFYPVG